MTLNSRLARFCQQELAPRRWKQINGWLVVIWLILFPLSIVTGLWESVKYVSLLSIYANVISHVGVWAASRAEVKADEA